MALSGIPLPFPDFPDFATEPSRLFDDLELDYELEISGIPFLSNAEEPTKPPERESNREEKKIYFNSGYDINKLLHNGDSVSYFYEQLVVVQVLGRPGRNLEWIVDNHSPLKVYKTRKISVSIPTLPTTYSITVVLEPVANAYDNRCFLSNKESNSEYFMEYTFGPITKHQEINVFLRTQQGGSSTKESNSVYKFSVYMTIYNMKCILHSFTFCTTNNHKFESSPHGKRQSQCNAYPIVWSDFVR